MALDDDISRYVTDTEGDVYAIVGLPEEILAVVFAYVSRSPKSFRENLLQVTAERAEQFHEKWVLHYGHASVAEHAVIHLGVERVSRHASAVLEDARLISVTEYSQRYQEPGESDMHVPAELAGIPGAEATARRGFAGLYALYVRLLEGLADSLRAAMPRKADETDAAWEKRLRRRAFEDARYVLPLATTTSLGLTTNAREMEQVISKCLSHPAAEIRRLGEAMRVASRRVAPTLIKYAAPLPYRQGVEERRLAELHDLVSRARTIAPPAPSAAWRDVVELAQWTGRGETPRAGETADAASERVALIEVLAALLEPGAPAPGVVRAALAAATHAELAERYLRLLGEPAAHESLPRALEAVSYAINVTLSEAAWHQLLRHRMMTSFPGDPRADLGLRIPPLVTEAGLTGLIEEAAALAGDTAARIPALPGAAAPYFVLNAHLRRVRIVMNLRQLHHLVRLRTSAHAQWDIREVTAAVLAAVRAVHPALVRRAG